MKRQDVINNSGYWLADIQMKLFDEVNQYLEANNMTRTDFAKQLGVSKGYISQILNGEFNHRIEKLIEIALAIGKVPNISFESIEDYSEAENKTTVKQKKKTAITQKEKVLSYA